MTFQVFTDQFEQFIGTNFWTMIFAWINILIMFLVLRKFLFKPVKKMIDSRQKEVDDMYANAAEANRAADEMRSDYEQKLAKATEESEQIVRDAVRKAQFKEEEMIKDAEAKASRILARAEEQIELEKNQAINDIKNEVSGIAVDLASAIIARDVDKAEHEQLIDDFIKNIGEENS
ncbi:MAG: F0F1 ATP synthase subunit B [Clostridia bacterium]|nr:F0F1 ATP synthase subunit B [Clostridia bacterium]MCR5694104.1 F0F1 ATP synthase subunit B [Clostridia bacterium]